MFASDDVRNCRPLQLSLARSNLHWAWGHGITPKQILKQKFGVRWGKKLSFTQQKNCQPTCTTFHRGQSIAKQAPLGKGYLTSTITGQEIKCILTDLK